MSWFVAISMCKSFSTPKAENRGNFLLPLFFIVNFFLYIIAFQFFGGQVRTKSRTSYLYPHFVLTYRAKSDTIITYTLKSVAVATYYRGDNYEKYKQRYPPRLKNADVVPCGTQRNSDDGGMYLDIRRGRIHPSARG